MLKQFTALIGLLIALNQLSGCLYYAEYEDKRAETEIKLQYKALLQTHAECLQSSQNNYARCPQPILPK
ncbi:MAG: hypothetical protein HOP02_15060 [Methylococcaceae bacterium]|nr:hypothetical protein [Methylococcaceae bacterium]